MEKLEIAEQENTVTWADLSPRSILPLSDSEIIDLYIVARRESDLESFNKEWAARLAKVDHDWQMVAKFISVVAIAVAIFLALAANRGVKYWIPELMVAAGAQGLYFLLRPRHKESRMDRSKIVPSSSEVLDSVVAFLTKKPVAERDTLIQSIRMSRDSIAISIKSLNQISSSLQNELQTIRDDSLRLMVESKRDAAVRCRERLGELDRDLKAQADQAMEAVAPLVEMQEKFYRLTRMSQTLSQIQSAHGLVEETEGKVEEHRLQLQLLQAISSSAMTMLSEIQSIVKAKEQAKREIEEL